MLHCFQVYATYVFVLLLTTRTMLKDLLNRPFVLPALVLGACLMLGTIIASSTFYSVRSLDNVISATGSATQDVKADRVKWTVSVYRTAAESEVPAAYTSVAADTATVEQFLKKQGIDAPNITESAVFSDQDYSGNSGGPKRYNVHQDITINSGDVEKIAQLSKDITALVAQGVLVSPQAPEYYVSNLPDLRVSLLGKAVQDAKARANQLVLGSGSHVGKLRGASSGVVQVLTPNSTNISDYGNYDTSTINKTVMVTARATFSVE